MRKCKHDPCTRHNDDRCCFECTENDECGFTCGYMEDEHCEWMDKQEVKA